MNTSTPWFSSSRTPSGVIATRCSAVLISFGTPTVSDVMSRRSPRVGLLLDAQVDERLGRAHARQRAQSIVHEVEQALVVLDHRLDEQVERTGGDDDVGDLGDRAIFSARRSGRLPRDPDHRHAPVPELQRIGDRDDLHHARLEQALHALAHGGLGQADGGAQLRVRRGRRLQLFDDGPVDLVEPGLGRRFSPRASPS